ncbi:MAG: radical SAM protein [Desulfobacterales bacterium]|nr:radical SAM protein [Desulfobacterales bacterium]
MGLFTKPSNFTETKTSSVNRHPGPLSNFEFSKEAIAQAIHLGRLLTLEIEFSLRCNFKCPYCYVVQDGDLKDELSPREIEGAILQAKSLGAGRIIVLGGEPSIYPHILDLIRFMRAHDLEVEMFTNGSGITPEFAGQLFDLNVRVVLKMNSFNEALQDRLSGRPGAFRIIQAALAHLKEAGYLSNDRFLAVSSIICRQNMPELPRMWRWLREQNIAPYFEIITPQANACLNDWLYVQPLELERFFQEIAALDRRLFGRVWEIQPPLVGNTCMRHQFSCLITAKGEVRPCVGITLPLGNIRRQPLGKILTGSRVLKDLKDYRRTIKGPCRTCDRAAECYGCRGAAFQLTGDYLASDPLCWRNARLQHPHPLLPHSGPEGGLACSLSDDR